MARCKQCGALVSEDRDYCDQCIDEADGRLRNPPDSDRSGRGYSGGGFVGVSPDRIRRDYDGEERIRPLWREARK